MSIIFTNDEEGRHKFLETLEFAETLKYQNQYGVGLRRRFSAASYALMCASYVWYHEPDNFEAIKQMLLRPIEDRDFWRGGFERTQYDEQVFELDRRISFSYNHPEWHYYFRISFLDGEFRTGLYDLGMRNGGTIAGHSYLVALTAALIPEEYVGFSFNRPALVRMGMFHDIGEFQAGDIPKFEKTDKDRKIEQEWVKSTAEITDRPIIFQDILEIDRRKTPRAVLLKDIDSLDVTMDGYLNMKKFPWNRRLREFGHNHRNSFKTGVARLNDMLFEKQLRLEEEHKQKYEKNDAYLSLIATMKTVYREKYLDYLESMCRLKVEPQEGMGGMSKASYACVAMLMCWDAIKERSTRISLLYGLLRRPLEQALDPDYCGDKHMQEWDRIMQEFEAGTYRGENSSRKLEMYNRFKSQTRVQCRGAAGVDIGQRESVTDRAFHAAMIALTLDESFTKCRLHMGNIALNIVLCEGSKIYGAGNDQDHGKTELPSMEDEPFQSVPIPFDDKLECIIRIHHLWDDKRQHKMIHEMFLLESGAQTLYHLKMNPGLLKEGEWNNYSNFKYFSREAGMLAEHIDRRAAALAVRQQAELQR